MKKVIFYCILLIIFLSACQANNEEAIIAVDSNIEIKQSDGSKSEVVRSPIILDQKIALTFNGLAEEETMREILRQLENANIKATFFLEGMRVAQEPDLVRQMMDKGHEVQNGTLTFSDVSTMDYEETYEEIYLANEVFEKHLDYKPSYIRSRSGDVTENMRLAASALDMDGVVEYSINPKDRDMQSAEEIADYIKRFLKSGAIIHLNTYINPAVIDAIPLLVEIAEEKGYSFAPLTEIAKNEYITKELKDIQGHDDIKEDLDYQKVKSHIFYRKNTNKKEIALTFDDYAGEERTREILDILQEYDIESTFFLIGKAVEDNPHLAKLILDSGHEVASHSYNHLNVTTMSPKELQEDVIQAHQALTHALQEPPLLYFRPAQGEIDEKSAKVITATGIQTIAMYDIASFDWNLEYTVQKVYDRVMERVGPGKVIVMHVLDESKTVEALPLIIEDLQKQGYTFIKLSKWIEQDKKESVD